jgi:hypothetical protein
MTAHAGQFAFSVATFRRRVSAQVSAGVLSMVLVLGSPLCQAGHGASPVAHDGAIDTVSPYRGSVQSLAVSGSGHKDGACCHQLVARGDAIAKSSVLSPEPTFTSALLAPSLASSVYLAPVTYAVRSMHCIPSPTTPLERLTDKLVL